MNKKTNTVWETDEYGRFELHELNRDIHEDPKLKESMRIHGFPDACAIHVRRNGGDKLKIIRGHHRFEISRELGLPVKYIIDDDELTIYELEGSTLPVWNGKDFAVSYAHGGSEDCRTLLRYQKKHGMTLGAAVSLCAGECAGSHNHMRRVKDGTFKIGDMKHANLIGDAVDFCKECGVEFATSAGFVAALSAASFVPEFDIETFKSRVRLYPKMMSRRTSKADYLIEIEAIYNYGARGKRLPLTVRAHEVSLERQRTFGERVESIR